MRLGSIEESPAHLARRSLLAHLLKDRSKEQADVGLIANCILPRPVANATGIAWGSPKIVAFDVLAQFTMTATWVRSEERRVGKECVSTCRSRWEPEH